jgi:hypothetical protein
VSSDGPESRVRVPAEWDRLELSVRRLLDDHERVRERERAAERRIQELETLLREVTGGGLDPVALNARVAALEAENRELVRRLEEARERVSRIIARLRFLEEER